MRPSLALFIFSLPLVTIAGSHDTPLRRRDRSSRRVATHARNATAARANFNLKDMYQGQDFLDKWDFFSEGDPTHGLVDYQSMSDAQSKGLAFVQGDGTTVLAVDDKTKLSPGSNRASVRISSKTKYNGGLFIADFFAMPHGCSVWPAWWSVGPNWPEGGEIDVVEGVHEQTVNQATLHTSEGCTTTANGKVAGKILGKQCASSGSDNSGCGFLDSDTRTYGHGFNMERGGVFAHLWTSSGIKVWAFSREEIPADIQQKKPNPDSWPAPMASWASDSCNIDSHFHDHVLTIDTTLCGDFAGATYNSAGCPGTCADAVADPSNFKHAKWMINYIAVYDN